MFATLMGKSVRKKSSRSDDDSNSTIETAESSMRSEESLRKVLLLLKSKMKTDLTQYKLTTVKRRVLRQMMMKRVEDMHDYVILLRKDPDALKELHDDLFIHVTEFFRDPDAFKMLAKHVFPALVKDRSRNETLRIWVPGCSTGEEVYSIVMALTEFLENHELTIPLQVFATDISERAVQIARRATYSESAVSKIGEKRLRRFFDKTADGYKIKKEFRDLCIVSQHDITNNPPFAKLDLISCRNVLIYFSADLQKRVMPIFHYALNPGRFLWLGQAETPGSFTKNFTVVDKKHKIYAKKNTTPFVQLPKKQLTPVAFSIKSLVAKVNSPEPDLHRNADQILLQKYAPAGAVINSDFDILQFKGRTFPYLEPAPGQPSHNLIKMAHPGLVPTLRQLVQVVRKKNSCAREEGLIFEHDGEKHQINIEVAPVNPAAPSSDRRYLVIFEEREKKARAKKSAIASSKQSKLVDPVRQQLQHLQQELDSQREYQQSLIEQFEATQEELRSSNEELQATNEEFQSTNEELETAKEELQSANEELTTMNDELHARNNDLIALNERLARSEERFRMMVEGVRDYAIFMLDTDGRIASWNEGARRFKGYEASEIIGQHISKFYSQEDNAQGKPSWELEKARLEGRVEDEGWRIRKDGTRFWANVVLTRVNDKFGNLVGYSKVTRDLTERRRADEEIRKSEERFRLLVSAVKDYAIFMLDPNGNIASWNEGAKRIKGYEASEIIGSHFSRFYTPEDIARRHPEHELKIAIKEGRYEEEGWRIRKDGRRFWANVVISRVDDANGKLAGFSKVTRDLSERKEADLALKRAYEGLELRVQQRTRELELALNSRDEFLQIASHELKTPLTSLILQLQMSRRQINLEKGKLPPPAKIAGALDLSVKQATSLATLIEDLLDISRIQAGTFQLEPQSVNLSELVEDVVTRMSQQLVSAGCTVDFKLSRLVRGHWDRHRLEQVVVNLISNAIKYAHSKPIKIETKIENDRAVLTVQDFGPGIQKEKQRVIFDRFERVNTDRNIGGLGLGLFITRRIVEVHNGRISVESEPGNGAKFIVELPVNSDQNP